MIHGVLHLLGYGDKTAEQQAQMREKEDFYIAAKGNMKRNKR
jgi:ssRNA-specific RNase YbeY (16S rRNA maturation enzyme)